MTIHVLSVIMCDGRAFVRARATAADVRISIELSFTAHRGATRMQLWQRARDEVLRYLDPA